MTAASLRTYGIASSFTCKSHVKLNTVVCRRLHLIDQRVETTLSPFVNAVCGAGTILYLGFKVCPALSGQVYSAVRLYKVSVTTTFPARTGQSTRELWWRGLEESQVKSQSLLSSRKRRGIPLVFAVDTGRWHGLSSAGLSTFPSLVLLMFFFHFPVSLTQSLLVVQFHI